MELPSTHKLLLNKEDGNCLFESVEQQYDHPAEENAHLLRIQLFMFYRGFNFALEYPDDSLKQRLVLAHNFGDNEDFDRKGRLLPTPHTFNVREDRHYAGVMDIIALAIMLKRPVDLYTAVGETTYALSSFTDEHTTGTPLVLAYNGRDHFEAVVPKLHADETHEMYPAVIETRNEAIWKKTTRNKATRKRSVVKGV